ncbi:MAG: phasin family protein [Chromatiales bacterium]|nr:phasin family protein [Chromatiales bacterium]
MITTKDNLEMMKDLTTTGFETARAFGELNLRTWEKFVAAQMDTFNLLLDTGIEQVKLSTETQDIKELTTGQTELAKKLGETLVAKGRENIETANDTRDEYRALVEKSVNTFTSKMTEAAQKAA